MSKIFGIGMSKTGTTTLAECLRVLGVGRHISYDRELHEYYRRTGNPDRLIEVARGYDSFEDAPWFLIYKDLDKAFPNSKFVLTVRKNSESYAKSAWQHGIRAGRRLGPPEEEYVRSKIKEYEKHNEDVLRYFASRPSDLLILCWERGDGWDKLCKFLGRDEPGTPFPHANVGGYRRYRFLNQVLENSMMARFIRATVYRVKTTAWVRNIFGKQPQD